MKSPVLAASFLLLPSTHSRTRTELAVHMSRMASHWGEQSHKRLIVQQAPLEVSHLAFSLASPWRDSQGGGLLPLKLFFRVQPVDE